MRKDSLKSYYDWLKDGAIKKEHEIIKTICVSEDANGFSSEVPTDATARTMGTFAFSITDWFFE